MDTFINKYKPYYLKDFTMEKHMRIMLKTLFELDDLNILFIGNSGSGKSTLLNAIIRDYYQLEKTDNIPEANVLFINNLKEQGINYYRNDMKTFCQSHSTIQGKKKMIVIDDLDNINEQSQQVFRNYIDKYKHNIHFISVCTNIQKIIESIQSRIHIIKIQSPSSIEIKEIMNMIIENEKIQINEEAKEYLLTHINDSIRILIHYLEKFHIYNKSIDFETCREMCSTISIQKFEQYFDLLKKKQLGLAIQVLYSIYDQGYSVIDILDYLFTFVKMTDDLTEDQKYQIIPFLCKYITIFNNIHEDVVELAFFSNNIYSIL
jgi:DNA polymerase III delta prime subunit